MNILNQLTVQTTDGILLTVWRAFYCGLSTHGIRDRVQILKLYQIVHLRAIFPHIRSPFINQIFDFVVYKAIYVINPL